MKFNIIAFAGLALLTGCAGMNIDGRIYPSSKSTLEDEFRGFRYTAPNGVELMAREYIPELGQRKVPLIVYLHGAGQNGNDNESQLDDSVGCIHAFMQGRDDYKAVILAPQCPVGVYWRDPDVLDALKSLIEKIVDGSPFIDDNRICVTGFSMGGDASWKLGLAYPDLMTTLVPVCGGPLASMEPDIPDVPSEMADLNIWAFNNYNDGTVRPNYAKRVFAQLWGMSDGDHLNFTEYLEGGHSPKQVYSDRNVLIWIINASRR